MSNFELTDKTKIGLGLIGSFTLGVISYKLYQDHFSTNKSKGNKKKTIKDELDQKSIERTHTENFKDLNISCHMESTNNLILDVPQIAILGDIGATNCRFVLYNMRSKLQIEDTRKSLRTHDYKSLEEALKDYIRMTLENDTSKSLSPYCSCICIAGTLLDNCQVAMANSPWRNNNAKTIATNLGLKYIKLLNDFEGIGYAMVNLDPDHLTPLNPKFTKLDSSKLIAVVGPGTGLGVCFQSSIEVNKQRNYKVTIQS